MQQDIH